MKKILVFSLLVLTSFCFGQTKKVNYKIVNSDRDNRGLINYLDVYVSNMSVIKPLNKQLFEKYKKTGIVTFQIYYYDDMRVALKYKKAVFNKRIQEEQLNKLSYNVVGVFVFNEYLKPAEDLKIGRHADDL